MTDPTPDLERIVKQMTDRLTDEEWNALEANPGIHPGPRDDPDLQRIVEEMAPIEADVEYTTVVSTVGGKPRRWLMRADEADAFRAGFEQGYDAAIENMTVVTDCSRRPDPERLPADAPLP